MTKLWPLGKTLAPMMHDLGMNQRKDHLDLFAVSILLACFTFWGMQQVLVKATLAEVPPLLQAGIRFAGATVLLWFWCQWRGIRLWERDGSLAMGLLAGGLFAIEFVCLFVGLQFSSASRVTVFLYTSPLWVAVLVPLAVPSERLARLQWLGLAFAFLAVAFTLREGFLAPEVQGQWRGDVLGVLAGMFWGLTTLVIRATRLSRISPEKLLFYQVALSGVLLPLGSWWRGEDWSTPWGALTWTSLSLQVVIGAFVTYLAWMWMLGRYPATKVSAFTFLTPVFSVLFGTLWLGEAITPALVGALVLIGAGIALVNHRPARPRA